MMMKLEKISEELNMFDKKNITLKDFKQKVVGFKNLTSKFRSWDYVTTGEDVKDKFANYLLIFFMVNFLSIPIFLLCGFSKIPWLSTILLLTMNGGITYYARNLKHGIFKNRYKQWQILKNDINSIMNDNNSICSILFEIEVQLKSLKKNLNNNEELEKIVDESIENLVKNMKNIFAPYEPYEGKNTDILQLLKNIEEIETYEVKIKNIIKNYQLNQTYYDYKKAHGVIENKAEKDSIEKILITDFKSLL